MTLLVLADQHDDAQIRTTNDLLVQLLKYDGGVLGNVLLGAVLAVLEDDEPVSKFFGQLEALDAVGLHRLHQRLGENASPSQNT